MSYRFTIVRRRDDSADLYVAPDGSLGHFDSVDKAVEAMDAALVQWGEDPWDATYEIRENR